MHKLEVCSYFLWQLEGHPWIWVWMAGWEKESEVSGEKRVDLRDSSTPMLLRPEDEKPEPNSGGTESLDQNREEFLLRIRKNKMNPDPA